MTFNFFNMNTSVSFKQRIGYLAAGLIGALLFVSSASAEILPVDVSADAYVRADSVNTTGTGNRLLLGQLQGSDKKMYDVRTLLRFDFSSIPEGATITSVQLVLYIIDNDSKPEENKDTTLEVDLHLMNTNEWSEGTATWNNTSGGNYSTKSLGSLDIATKGLVNDSNNALKCIWTGDDLLGAVISSYESKSYVMSFVLENTDADANQRQMIRFVSKDQDPKESSWLKYAPQLVIEYTLNSVVPEPASYAAIVAVLGLGAACVVSRRRR